MDSAQGGSFQHTYSPSETEPKHAKRWVEQRFFEVQDGAQQGYTIVIPPPNVTGDLHIGHVLNNTLQDILIRWQRLKGRSACWIPGTDHASIATEAKVTAALQKEGRSKHAMGREAFLQEAYRWKEKYSGRITDALKRMGASCDWSREVFTMDDGYSRTVLTAFVELYNKGLVYRGKRLVNWCPASQSVISDEEVTSEERQGHLWHIAYRICADTLTGALPNALAPQELVVATTRPETLFGDLALAVHPDDERYAALVGASVLVPVCGRKIPVIADTYVDRDFGTGVVKITPAHDKNDFDVGQRHGLGLLNVMNPDASLNDQVPEGYRGLDRYVARKKLVSELKDLGLLVKTDNHKLVLGISERGQVPIEYYLSDQWYFRMEGMAKLALEATRSGALTLYPKYTEKIWDHWLENIQDWCVSRQLWWGHRIPVYTCTACHKEVCQVETPVACPHCGHKEMHQENDVLDTWASSWLWPFAVHGWPPKDEASKQELERFYPTEVIVTGQDIIFFWIARMVMAGRLFTNQMPFHSVYFTPLVRDDKGRKMSKSIGNSPDIHELMSTFGADALRFSLIHQIVLGQDIYWKNERCDMGRHFANKLWNAARFLTSAASRCGVDVAQCSYESLSRELPKDDTLNWILSEYHATVLKADESLKTFQFSEYAAALYEFLWLVYCDWFVELLKPKLETQETEASGAPASVLVSVALALFDGSLRLLHPLMPFVTEEIWQELGKVAGQTRDARSLKTIGHQAWPDATLERFPVDTASIARMRRVQSVVTAVRAIRGQYTIHPGVRLKVFLPASESPRLGPSRHELERLARVEVCFGGVLPAVVGAALTDGVRVLVDLTGHVEASAEKQRLVSRITRLQSIIEGIDKKLGNAAFVAGAPPEIVAGAKGQRQQNADEMEALNFALSVLDAGGGMA
jgi:valyl-tRNA synthetase